MQRVAVLALLLVATSPSEFPASTTAAAEPSPAHVLEAAEALYASDRVRVRETTERISRQDIFRHDIDIALDPHAGTLSAVDRVEIELTGPDAVLALDPALTVSSVRDSAGRPLPFEVSGGRVTVSVPGEERRQAVVAVSYRGDELGSDRGASAMFLLLSSDRTWYPNGTTHDPALLRVTVRYPAGFASVCTGTLSGMVPPTQTTESHPVGDVWDASTPVRGAALLITSLDNEWGFRGDVSLSVHQRHTAQRVAVTARDVRDALGFLESCFGPYPFDWLHVVLVEPRSDLALPLRGPGFVVLEASPSSGEAMSRLVGCIAASWWSWSADAGPLVADGLAGQAELRWLRASGDEEEVRRRRELRRYQYVRALTDAGGTLPLSMCLGPSPAEDLRLSMGKGTAFFEMLEHIVGPGAFCSGLRQVAEQWRGGPVPFDQVVGAVAERAERDLEWFVYDWVVRGDLPTYSLDYETNRTGDGRHRILGTIRQDGEAYRTPLPLTVDLGGWAYEEWVPITSADQSFEITTETAPLELVVDASWIIPKLDPEERAHAHFERGLAAAEQNEWGRATDELGAAARLAPDRAAYWFEYGEALVRSGRVPPGIEAVERAVRTAPDDLFFRTFLTRLYLSVERYEDALDSASVLLEGRPDDVAFLSDSAVALVGLGRFEEAGVVLERARDELNRTDAPQSTVERFHLAVGIHNESLGALDEAESVYREALMVNPLSDEARRGLERVRRLREETE